MPFRRIGIITKRDSKEPQAMAEELSRWLAERSIASVRDRISPDLDLLVILGGDGTLLHVADAASAHDIPVVGINLGGLGFLTEIAANELYEVMTMILAGRGHTENRMMLRARIRRGQMIGEYHCALNEVAISKSHVDRIVRLSTWADGDYITTYKADGLLFSTPTGSTAYNLSAGGPIVHPAFNSILVTPICPFMLESRPILLPPQVRLRTRISGPVQDVKVILDGQCALSVEADDILEVEASEKPLRLIGSPVKSYYEILRSKLNWGGAKTPPAMVAIEQE